MPTHCPKWVYRPKQTPVGDIRCVQEDLSKFVSR